MKVIIVGAGIIGASCAYHLRQSGAEVTVVDALGAGGRASADSFGWINANFAENDDYYRFRRQAIDRYRSLSQELDLPSLRWRGALWWEEEGEAFDAEVAVMRARGYEIDVVDRDGFEALEPHFALPPERAVLGHVEGAANGDQVARQLLAASGAQLIANCKVLSVGQGCVETTHGQVSGDVVLVAAGAATGRLTGLPMNQKSGVILHTTPGPRVIEHIIMSPGLYLRQDLSGRIIMGSHFTGAGLEGYPIEELGPMMLERLQARLPDVDVGVETVRFGTRPVPIDGLPMIGWRDGIYVAVMHSGITLAPLVGQLVAQEITGDVARDLGPYRPDRMVAMGLSPW